MELHEWAREKITAQLGKQSETRSIQDILTDMNSRINFAVAGIGLVHPTGADATYSSQIERLTMTGLVKPPGIDPETLMAEGAVGGLSYSLYNASGQDNPLWKLFITAGDGSEHSGVDFYRNPVEQGRKVIVMTGARKMAALLPAIHAKLFNVLITDSHAAQRLLASK
jgi:DNA-binding transcriptional regulator LsrR (DeoR family)